MRYIQFWIGWCLLLLISGILGAINQGADHGSDFQKQDHYFGDELPGMKPILFAPGIVSGPDKEHSNPAISLNGKEIYWSVWPKGSGKTRSPQVIRVSKFVKGKWTKPRIVSFSGQYMDGGPSFSPDGKTLYFYSNRPRKKGQDKSPDLNIWRVDRKGSGWSEPVLMPEPINSNDDEAGPYLDRDGTFFLMRKKKKGLSDIYAFRLKDGQYLSGKKLSINRPDARESTFSISRDGQMMVFTSDSRQFDRGKLVGGTRCLKISFRRANGSWGAAIDAGDMFNQVGARFPGFSPDGRYLFFTRYNRQGNEDMYWVSTAVLGPFRPKNRLLAMIEAGQLSDIKNLVEDYPKLLTTQIWGNYPLSHAAMMGKREIGKFLISKGVNPDLTTRPGGMTALGFAIEMGDKQFIEMLLNGGANLHYRTDMKESYLHFAAFFNKPELIDYFLDRGIPIDIRKKGGMTPLHIAAAVGNIDSIKVLIRGGAKLNLRANDGGTALHFSEAAGFQVITSILKKHGAKSLERRFSRYFGKYLGAKQPGKTPRPFVPEIFADIYRPHSAPAFSPDGKAIYWEAMFMWGRMDIHRIWYMKEVNGRWTAPKRSSFSKFPSFTPVFSPDGSKLFYSSQRPVQPGGDLNRANDLWYVERRDGAASWSAPRHLGMHLHNRNRREIDPHITADNTLYFSTRGLSQISKSRFIDGIYQKPEALGNLFDPDSTIVDNCKQRKYLIVASDRRKGNFLYELYVSFHQADGRWSKPVFMGDELHQGTRATRGRILPCGNYLIFSRYMAWFWVDVGLIENLRSEKRQH